MAIRFKTLTLTYFWVYKKTSISNCFQRSWSLIRKPKPYKNLQMKKKNSMRDQILKKANFQDFQTFLGVKNPCKHTSLCLLLSPPPRKREYPTQTTKLIYKLHGVQYHYLTIDSFKSFWTSTGVTTPWFITKLGKCFATSLVLCRKENNPKIIALSYVAKEETRDFMCPMALWGRDNDLRRNFLTFIPYVQYFLYLKYSLQPLSIGENRFW